MERLVVVSIVIVHIYIISECHAYPGIVGTVIVDDGKIGIGAITGGKFGPGSFSIGQPGSPRPEYNDGNVSDEDGGHVVLQNAPNNGGQGNNNRPPQQGALGTVMADAGQVGIGAITGGKFGPESFSIGQPGSPRPEYNYENNGNDDGRHVVLQYPENNGAQRKNSRPSQHDSTGALGTVMADAGQGGIGAITGGKFGPESFSIGQPGRPRPEYNYVNNGDGGGENVVLQNPANNGAQRKNSRPSQHGSTGTLGTVMVDDGQVGIGAITCGKFGPESFSINQPGSPRPEYNNGNGDAENVVLHNPANNDAPRKNKRPSQHGNTGNRRKPQRTQSHPVKPQKAEVKPGQGGKRGQGGSRDEIVIGAVVVPNNKKRKGNKRRNHHNKRPVSSDAIEGIFARNGENNDFPSSGNNFGSNGDQGGNIHIGLITGENFEHETSVPNNNKRPTGANEFHEGSAINNGMDTLYAIGHGANNNGDWHTGDGYVNGQTNSEYDNNSSRNEERKVDAWVWT